MWTSHVLYPQPWQKQLLQVVSNFKSIKSDGRSGATGKCSQPVQRWMQKMWPADGNPFWIQALAAVRGRQKRKGGDALSGRQKWEQLGQAISFCLEAVASQVLSQLLFLTDRWQCFGVWHLKVEGWQPKMILPIWESQQHFHPHGTIIINIIIISSIIIIMVNVIKDPDEAELKWQFDAQLVFSICQLNAWPEFIHKVRFANICWSLRCTVHTDTVITFCVVTSHCLPFTRTTEAQVNDSEWQWNWGHESLAQWKARWTTQRASYCSWKTSARSQGLGLKICHSLDSQSQLFKFDLPNGPTFHKLRSWACLAVDSMNALLCQGSTFERTRSSQETVWLEQGQHWYDTGVPWVHFAAGRVLVHTV